VDQALYDELISKSDVYGKLRLTAVAIKHPADWIKALPNAAINHKLNNDEYSVLGSGLPL